MGVQMGKKEGNVGRGVWITYLKNAQWGRRGKGLHSAKPERTSGPENGK